jgi:hypothetical protein
VQTLAEMLVELEMKCEAEALRDVRRRGRRL